MNSGNNISSKMNSGSNNNNLVNKPLDGRNYNSGVHSPAEQTAENIRRALRINESTNETGYATVQSLGRQRETIQHSLLTVDDTHQTLHESRGIIRNIRFEVYKEWLVKGCIIAALVGLIVLIFYVKFVKR